MKHPVGRWTAHSAESFKKSVTNYDLLRVVSRILRGWLMNTFIRQHGRKTDRENTTDSDAVRIQKNNTLGLLSVNIRFKLG